MLSKVLSYGLKGIEGYPVLVETDIGNGLPMFDTVGLPDTAVKESKDRVRAALKNSGYALPAQRVTVNLAPAHLKKEGPIYDLPIAIGILAATRHVPTDILENTVILGELALDGHIRPIIGVLPMMISAREKGYTKAILPMDNAEEAACVHGLTIYPVETLTQLIEFLNDEKDIAPQQNTSWEEMKLKSFVDSLDFAYVKGQQTAKRAMEVAAAGGHNILLIGSPGSGKTMLAKCLPSILPNLTFEEALEITKIHSAAGALRGQVGMVTQRPFRAPHHTISTAALSGGGASAMPGEVSLAHFGVLFLDEFPEFNRAALECLRQPMEDGVITISRVNATITYPAKFMLVAAMNPCPCGHFGAREQNCRCTSAQIQRYLNGISGPLLDRIDMHIHVDNVSFQQLRENVEAETSATIKQRVDFARQAQLNRYKRTKIFSNGQLETKQLNRFCAINQEGHDLLKKAFAAMHLSARAYSRILRVARTIADLEGSENIGITHLAEAIQYRNLDRKFWDA